MTGAAIELMNVTVTRGVKRAVDSVSAIIQPGAVTVIAGPNGAGKSTLLKAIAALLPYSGTIAVAGISAQVLSHRERAQTLSYLPQMEPVAWPLTVERVVALGRLPYTGAGLRLSDIDKAAVEAAIAKSALEALRNRRIDMLSEGERARVLLARALAVEARVLLADEPVASLDPYHRLQIMDVLKAEAAAGVAVAVVLHDLALAAAYADKVILMDRGRVVSTGFPHDVFSDDALAKVYRITSVLPGFSLKLGFARLH